MFRGHPHCQVCLPMWVHASELPRLPEGTMYYEWPHSSEQHEWLLQLITRYRRMQKKGSGFNT